jgi:ABC-2 type transport system permease protein
MRLYWEVAKRAFRRWSTYRAATFAGVFTNTVFGFLQAYVLLAVYRERDLVGGFDATDAVTFSFVTQGFLMMVWLFNWNEIAERVRTGDVVTDLYRPVDFQLYWLAQDLGRATFHALARGLPPYLAGSLVFDLEVSGEPLVWLLFPVMCWLAVVISFGVRFMVNLTAFWLLDIRGPNQAVMVVWMFLSGFVLPITFFPPWLEAVARATPFAAIVQFPVEALIGKYDAAALLGVLALQAAWALALLGAGRWLLAAATRKVVVQGG